MALDRLLPVSTTPGAVTGDSYMDAVQEEVTGLWDRSTITLTAVAGTNTITATATPAMTGGLGGNMNFILKPAATNTSSVTLNVNGGGAVAVVDAEGTALVAGALRINGNYFLHYDSGISKYVIVNYVPAATRIQGLVWLATAAALATPSTIDFFNGATPSAGSGTVTASGTAVLDDTYDSYLLDIATAKPASDDVEPWIRIGTGGGPTYQTANYRYGFLDQAEGSNAAQGSASDAKIRMTSAAAGGIAVGNAAGENISATVNFSNPESTTEFVQMSFLTSYTSAGSVSKSSVGGGRYNVAGAITAIRFMFSSGNITSGRFTLYGRTKA